MATVGNLSVVVSANTLGLANGLAIASNLITGFGSKLGSAATKIGPFAAAITGIAGATGFGLMVKNSMAAIDANEKLADSLGITLGQLTGYQHAAELAGVDTDLLASTMKKLQRRGKTLEEIADGMASITNSAQQVGGAVDVAGTSLGALASGDANAAINKSGKSLKDLGVHLDKAGKTDLSLNGAGKSVKHLTASMAAAERASIAVGKVGKSFRELSAATNAGAKLQLDHGQLAGSVESGQKAAAAFKKANSSLGQLTDGLSSAGRTNLSLKGIGKSVEQLTDSVAAAERARYAFDQMGKSGQDLIPLLSGGSAALKEMVDEGERLSGLKGMDTKSLQEANDAVTRAKAAFTGIANVAAITVAPALELIAEKAQQFGEFTRDAFKKAIAAGRFAFDNLPAVAELAFAKVELSVTSLVADFGHLFGVKIPAIVTFAVDNAGRIMVDGFGKAVENLADNMAQGFEEIFAFIASGGTDAIKVDWKPLSEGFAEVFADMPEIAAREMTEVEKVLADDIARLQERLGKDFELALNAPVKVRGRMDPPEVVPGEVPAAGAAIRGSREAFSSIFSNMRGSGGSPMVQLVNNAAKQVEGIGKVAQVSKDSNKILSRIESKLDIEVATV